MTPTPTISIIIPTYNRKVFLYETLDSLTRQNFPAAHFEVIVVDDGSTDETSSVIDETFPFALRYFWQENQGDAEARNLGAKQSEADILVFLDDDILVEPDYLEQLAKIHGSSTNKIVVGVERLWTEDTSPLLTSPLEESRRVSGESEEMPFVDVCSNNMSIWRRAYFNVGMMQALNFPGSSIWCDVDFAYRAFCQGFEFQRSMGAVCWHRDHVRRDLQSHKRRMKETAYRAVVLFQKYPELQGYLPMFSDKTPINWRQDSPALITRKLSRSWASTRLAMWGMERCAELLQMRYSSTALFQALYRWIIGGYIYRGYRAGLREFASNASFE
ncbi:MAG: glycosyltransferase family 2 protein [Ardenticatenaceae bacterium]|nr:glycosyltransferase family 2 protein [Ardenticatenaceae bacterium]